MGTRQLIQVGKWVVDSAAGWIRLPGEKEETHIRPKLMDVLTLLVQAKGKVVTRKDLLLQGWPETLASDESLTRCISDLRKLFGDDGKDTAIIKTIPKRGYRIDCSVIEEIPQPIDVAYQVQRSSKCAIIVLPFSVMHDKAQSEYLAEGISEDILSLLSRAPDLRVIAKPSAFSFKGRPDPEEITRHLNVDYILNGFISGSESELELTLDLMNTRSMQIVWHRSLKFRMNEIHALQGEVAATIMEHLGVSVPQDLSAKENVDPQVYMLMLQGRHLANLVTPEGWKQSNEHFRKVLVIDPEYADAWAGLAKNYAFQACDALRSFQEGFTLARASVNRALEVDSRCSMALAMDGWLHLYESFDHQTSAESFEKALEFDPYNTDTLLEVAHLARAMGRLEIATRLCKFVVSRDPINAKAYRNLGIFQRVQGDSELAAGTFKTMLALSPGISSGQTLLGFVLNDMGRSEAALAAVEKESSEIWQLIGLSMINFTLNKGGQSDAALQKLIAKFECPAAYNIAYVEAFRGNSDQAFHWLQKAREYGDPGIAHFVTEKYFANIQNDKRWTTLLEQTGQSPEKLATIKLDILIPE